MLLLSYCRVPEMTREYSITADDYHKTDNFCFALLVSISFNCGSLMRVRLGDKLAFVYMFGQVFFLFSM